MRSAVEEKWMGELRERARNRFQKIGFPNRKLDAWKYVDLSGLLESSLDPATCRSESRQVTALLRRFGFPGKGKNHLVFVNGDYDAKLSSPPGEICVSLKSCLKTPDDLLRSGLDSSEEGQENDAFFALNSMHFRDGSFLNVPEGTTVKEPVHVWFLGTRSGDLSPVFYLRNIFLLGRGAKATVILHSCGEKGARYLASAVHQIRLGRDAELKMLNVQRASQNAFEFSHIHCRQSRGSSFEVVNVTEGSLLTRNETRVSLEDEGASASLRGLSLLSDTARFHHHVSVSHRHSGCSSRQLFKNVLSGQSRSEFSGLVHVHRGANQSDASQINRNLVLSGDAHAYARPQFKIDADDVQCKHGATVGQLEPGEIFYLKSRGLDETASRSLLTYGFAEEVLEDLKREPYGFSLEDFLREKLREIL